MNNKHLSMTTRRNIDLYKLNHIDFWNEYTAQTIINWIIEVRQKALILKHYNWDCKLN